MFKKKIKIHNIFTKKMNIGQYIYTNQLNNLDNEHLAPRQQTFWLKSPL
jgi:hypothetical protein